MKTIIALWAALALLVLPAISLAAISVTQSAQTDNNSISTIAVTLSGSVTAGDAIVLWFGSTNGNPAFPTPTSISDSELNSYTLIRSDVQASGDFGTHLWQGMYVSNVVAGGGANTITIVETETVQWAIAAEIAGQAASSLVDVNNGAIGGSATPTVNLTTTNASDMLLGVFERSFFASTQSPGAGFTTIQNCSIVGALAEYQTVSSASTYAVNGTLNAVDSWVITAAAFKAAGGAAAAPAIFFSSSN